MTGGNMFGLDGIQSDDELLDRLAAREPGSGDDLEVLLGAWAREIEEEAEEVAGAPMPWMGQARPKPRAVKVHRAAAVAGALVVTLSGGMAAVALMPTETSSLFTVGVRQSVARILPIPASTTPSTLEQAKVSQQPVPPPEVRVGTQEANRPVQEPTAVWTPSVIAKPSSGPGLPPLTTTVTPTTSPSPTTVPVPPNQPSAPQPSTAPTPGTGSAPESPSVEPTPGRTPTTDGSTAPTGSPEPTPSKTSQTPVPPDVKDSSPVTTPGGVVLPPEGERPSAEASSVPGATVGHPEAVPETVVPSVPSASVGTPVGEASPGSTTIGE